MKKLKTTKKGILKVDINHTKSTTILTMVLSEILRY